MESRDKLGLIKIHHLRTDQIIEKGVTEGFLKRMRVLESDYSWDGCDYSSLLHGEWHY